LLNVLQPFEEEAAPGSIVATMVGHASMVTDDVTVSLRSFHPAG